MSDRINYLSELNRFIEHTDTCDMDPYRDSDFHDEAQTATRVLMIELDEQPAADFTSAYDLVLVGHDSIVTMLHLLRGMQDQDRGAFSALALSFSLCPLHLRDYAICFDDEDPECVSIRTCFPGHESGSRHQGMEGLRMSTSEDKRAGYCKEQLGALQALGYLASWQHEMLQGKHRFTISFANGGVYQRLHLDQTRLLLAGLLTGAQGRETSVHLTRYDYGVLFTALENLRTLQTDLDESYSAEILASLSRLTGYFSTQQGFE